MTTFAQNGTAYDLQGPEHAPVVALIHGLGLCRHVWRDHLPALSQRYRVLNYDFFGHGDSASAPEKGSLAVYARQLRDVMDELNIPKAALVGFSIGGMINRRFALDYPDRVSALAILNSPHERGEHAQQMVEERAAKVAGQGALSTMDEALKRWFTPDYLASDADGPALVREWRIKADQNTYPDACMVLAAGVPELIRPTPPVTAPSLVMTCEHDSGSTPAMSYAIASEITGAETIIVPHLQHLGLMQDSAAFTQPILSFLDRVLKDP